MKLRLLKTLFTLFLSLPLLAEEMSAQQLEIEGTLIRLQGHFDQATEIEKQLLETFDEPVGHIFAINTIITHLTWDETDTQYDAALEHHTSETLRWCEEKLKQDKTHVQANYYCGQANFALSFYSAVRGSYYQAGRRGTTCIDYLETALQYDPNLVDAKMHLGVAYYAADNLPPFIKMFSRLLWFIPTGNSEKSLPYLKEVIETGDQYKDVARYIYAVVALEEESLRVEAQEQLEYLVDLYPQNARFQLRLISLLLIQDNYEDTLSTALAFVNSDSPPPEPDLSLTKIWMVRAYMGLEQLNLAQSLFAEIDPIFEAARNELPGWSLSWHMLTDGQLNDLAERRQEAVSIYNEILEIAKSTYVSETIIDAAEAGLAAPYRIRVINN